MNTLNSKIDNFKIELENAVQGSMERSSSKLFNLINSRCRVKTGYLKSTGRKSNFKLGFVISYSALYAKYVEFRYSWLRKSLIELENDIIEDVRSSINKVINKL